MTNAEAANQAWDILVLYASGKRTITYGDLAGKIGLANQGITKPLALIYNHCNDNNSVTTGKTLPPLTVLVVNKNDDSRCSECGIWARREGHPNTGYTQVRDSVPMDSYAVFMHDWAKEPKPNF